MNRHRREIEHLKATIKSQEEQIANVEADNARLTETMEKRDIALALEDEYDVQQKVCSIWSVVCVMPSYHILNIDNLSYS